MASTNKDQHQYLTPDPEVFEHFTPQMAEQLTKELCAAWDAIQPMDVSWSCLLASRRSTAAALKNLNELARPAFAETEEQHLALLRMRLLLDALGLRRMTKN